MATKEPYKVKNPYYVDMVTGFIKAGTEVIETDERYKNRFIPWRSPIPKGGRVDLVTFQQQISQGSVLTAEQIAEREEFEAWKRNKAEINHPVATDKATLVASAGTESEGTKVAGTANVTLPDTSGVKPAITASERMEKLIAAMAHITEEDMTQSKDNSLPKVSSLARITGIEDVQGVEREIAFSTFKEQNPDWKPSPAA